MSKNKIDFKGHKKMYTIGNWSIYIKSSPVDGSIVFKVHDCRDTNGFYPEFVSRGFVKETWTKKGIRSAWDIAIKRVNKQHQFDLEAASGMEMATSIAENFLSDAQIDDLLEAVLT